jgi:hypothetical protein
MTTRFQLASEKTASNIIPKNVKVYVNGSDVPLESEYGAYDPETGEMALSYMGANLKSLEIVISKSKGRAVGVGLGTAKVGSINVLAYLAEGTKDVFSVGSSIDVVGKFGNNSYIQTVHWNYITNLEQQQVDISILWTGMMVMVESVLTQTLL